LEEDLNTAILFGRLNIHPERIERYKKRRGKRENEIQSATGKWSPYRRRSDLK
jgi:hypothetical protein